jgi:SAM-dependent methyltransferase
MNATWPPGYHDRIRELSRSAGSVLDLGCGSGHAFANLRRDRLRYTGVDWSVDQIKRNVARYGSEPNFIGASLYETGLRDGMYDLTFSNFVLEHLVWPHRFLAEMVRLTAADGHLAILCPHFRPFGRIPSLSYGKRPATIKQRVRRGHIFAAIKHLYRRNVYYPRAIRRHFPSDRYPFLINLAPSCLDGEYYSDNDAVYLVDRIEVVQELARLGADDVTETLPGLAAHDWARDGFCFVVAKRRPAPWSAAIAAA